MNNSNSNVQILDKLVVISLAGTRIFSGRRKLTEKDLGKDVAGKLPPTSLTSLGVIRTCDSKSIAPFATARSQAEKLCLEQGTRFLGGFAMTEEAMKDLIPKLQGIKKSFYDLKPNFLAEYQDSIDAWASTHQEWRHLIDEHIQPADYVSDNLHFNYQAFKVAGLDGDFGLEDAATGLANQIISEVAATAKTLADALGKQNEMTQKGLNPLRSIRNKLDGLSFIDVQVTPIIDLIDEALNRLPKHGKIEGVNYMAVSWLVNLISNPKKLKAHGQMILDGQSSASSIVDENTTAEEPMFQETPTPLSESQVSEEVEVISEPNDVSSVSPEVVVEIVDEEVLTGDYSQVTPDVDVSFAVVEDAESEGWF